MRAMKKDKIPTELAIEMRLPSGGYTTISSVSIEHYRKYSWHLNGNGYVKRLIPRGGGRYKHVYLHRELLGLGDYLKDGRLGDHVNRNKLDNRPENLRVVDKRGNNINRGRQRNNVTGTTGVSPHSRGGYHAHIYSNGKLVYLGYFKNIDDARAVRVEAERLLGWHEL